MEKYKSVYKLMEKFKSVYKLMEKYKSVYKLMEKYKSVYKLGKYRRTLNKREEKIDRSSGIKPEIFHWQANVLTIELWTQAYPNVSQANSSSFWKMLFFVLFKF